jgi:hypothetical protein
MKSKNHPIYSLYQNYYQQRMSSLIRVRNLVKKKALNLFSFKSASELTSFFTVASLDGMLSKSNTNSMKNKIIIYNSFK